MRGYFIFAFLTVVLTNGIAAAQKSLPPQKPAAAQKSTPAAERRSEIYNGQPFDELVQAIRQWNVEFYQGGLEVSTPDRDQSSLTFTLDHDHAVAHVFFSKSKRITTGIWIDYFPARTAQAKGNRSTVSALGIMLYPDQSYAVHFAKPRTLDELLKAEANRPQSVYPTNPAQVLTPPK